MCYFYTNQFILFIKSGYIQILIIPGFNAKRITLEVFVSQKLRIA